MKIAFVNHANRVFVPPPEGGSVEIWIHEVARRLAKSCEVIVYSPRGHLPKVEWCDGVQYRRVSDPGRADRVIRRIQKLRGGWRATRSLNRSLHDFRSGLCGIGYSFGVAMDLRSQHCDIVHSVNLSQWLPVFRSLDPGIKTVLHMHCEYLTRLDRNVIERRLASADRIIGCSQFVTSQIESVFPAFAPRCATVYNGVDVEHFVPSRSPRAGENGVRRILFVSRVAPEKGLHVLLDAFAMVVKRCPRARLEIVGPMSQVSQLPLDVLATTCSATEVSRLARFHDGKGYVSHLEEQIVSQKLTQAVTFVGPLPQGRLSPYYRQADVFVLPSVCNESFGMPIAEAMASGIPVVATRVGGVPEVAEHGKTGFLVEPNDPAALAEAILRLLNSEDLRRSMGQAARRQAVERFSWEKITQGLLQIYRALKIRSSSGRTHFFRRRSPVMQGARGLNDPETVESHEPGIADASLETVRIWEGREDE